MDSFRDWVLSRDPGEFWLLAGGALAVALTALVFGLRNFWKLRLILDTPTARIRSAAQGYVELAGFARRRHQSLMAPLTKTPCVWYRYQVQERQSSGRDNNWKTVDKGQSEQAFVLDDGTGRCLVDPAGAIIKLRTRDKWRVRKPSGYYNKRQSPPRSLSSFLGLETDYLMTEERIHADEPVYLLGHFETPRRGSQQRRALTNQLLRQWKRDPERMRAFDQNQDGEIDPDEWEAAREQARTIAEQSEQRLSARTPLPRVGQTGNLSQPFVISTISEESLASRLRWETIGATAVSLILGTAGALGVVLRLSQ